MPEIRPSADLRNKYSEISEYCHEHQKPVYITKNGKGDLAVMSIDTYEKLTEKYELYNLIEEGLKAMNNNETTPVDDVISKLRRKLEG